MFNPTLRQRSASAAQGRHLRWHRQLFRLVWRRNSKPKTPQTRITPETIALIKQIRTENVTWGAERIRGGLTKLGIKVSGRERPAHHPTLSAPGNVTFNLALQPELRDHPAELCRSDMGLRLHTGSTTPALTRPALSGARRAQSKGHRPAYSRPPEAEPPQTGKIFAFPVLGGLHHDYRRAA